MSKKKKKQYNKKLCFKCGKSEYMTWICIGTQQLSAIYGESWKVTEFLLTEGAEWKEEGLISYTGKEPWNTASPEWNKLRDAEVNSEVSWNMGSPEWEKQCEDWTGRLSLKTLHGYMSWTACYNDGYVIHLEDKVGAGWFPRKSKIESLNATHQEEPGDEELI